MADITDFFGKASIDSDHAIATTVKTERAAGVTVLEAFDVSKFSDDTPVFVVTYKKTTDPLTDEVSITELVSWKALVNVGANTLTNLTLAPGYTDLGNDVGDFIECIPTSYWANSLIEGIQTSLSPDGTLKDGAVDGAEVLADDVVTTDKIADGAVDHTKVATGAHVQMSADTLFDKATGTTQIPFDTSTPQNTEGTEFMTLAHTPKSATNILVIDVKCLLSTDTGSRNLTAALFKNTTADALGASSEFTDDAATLIPRQVTFTVRMVAGTTSEITFKVRGGANNTGTVTFNGVNNTDTFGAISKSSIVINEYKAT